MNGTIYLNTREAAARLRLSARTLDRYRVSGDFSSSAAGCAI